MKELDRVREAVEQFKPWPPHAEADPDDNEHPSDDQIARWIKLNPGKFAAWIRKRHRIEGRGL